MGLTGVALAATGGYYYLSLPPRDRLEEDRFVLLRVLEKEPLSHDTIRLRLANTVQPQRPYPILSCMHIKDDNIQVMRSYTPINSNPLKDGYMDLVVKRYANGSISRMLSSTDVGEELWVRGPAVEFDYQPNTFDSIGMVTRSISPPHLFFWCMCVLKLWVRGVYVFIDCRRDRYHSHVPID